METLATSSGHSKETVSMGFPSDSKVISMILVQAEQPGIGIWLCSLQAVQIQIIF